MPDVLTLAKVDTGDTAWMLMATALVLMMTPALGLFYAGLVRSKNTLNTFMMCVAAIAIAVVTWAAVGYSLAFSEGGDLIGSLDYAFLNDVGFEPRDGQTIPHLVFMAFQMMFAVITPALISGAVVGRMRFKAYAAFIVLWALLVYNPLARWVRFTVISGIDTESGWGLGGAIVGNGPLDAFSCNPAYSSRPLAPVLGRRTDVWAATCSVAVPF